MPAVPVDDVCPLGERPPASALFTGLDVPPGCESVGAEEQAAARKRSASTGVAREVIGGLCKDEGLLGGCWSAGVVGVYV